MLRLFVGLVAIVVAFPLSASSTDDIRRVRPDGEPGWRASIARDADSPGASKSPLLAPVWFAKVPKVKIRLAPEGSFDLAAADGKVLLLDYWASWCAPCLQELPHLQALHVTRSKDGFVALAVNVDEDAASAASSAKGLGLTMMIGLNDPEVKATLGVRSLPTLLAFDRQGRLRGRWDGYTHGLEKDISSKVDKLLADDPQGTTRDVATVLAGHGRLQARWLRDLPGTADGVVTPPEGADGARVVASSGDQLISFDAAGETVSRVKTISSAGQLLDFGIDREGRRELVGFRPGATSVSVIALRSGTQRSIALPAPLLDIAAVPAGKAGERRLAVATMRGAAMVESGSDRAVLVEGAGNVRSIAGEPGGRVVALREDGSVGGLDAGSPTWSPPAAGVERLFAARQDGALTAPRSVVAAVSGRFLATDSRQLAVATHAGRLVLLDEATGAVQFDAVWPAVTSLAGADLDGDGRDELFVAFGRSIAALGAAGR